MTLALRPLAIAAALLLTAAAAPPPPSELFGPLFAQVQERRIFADGKTFADAVPRRDPAAILADWRREAPASDAALRAFVGRNFDLPPEAAPQADAAQRLPILSHITALWPVLTRRTPDAPHGSSLLTLPAPYVVPGGRFREIYYWDSYFTMLGLAKTGRQDLVESMIVDFGSLIDRYGHIPNGTRSYYLSRSQPPFFYLMAGLSKRTGRADVRRRADWMRAEYRFWMAGSEGLVPGGEHRRVVRLGDGALLNRYWDDRATPRDESWREDVELARANPARSAPDLYRDIRAAAESGWDFSSRWLADGRTLGTIRTTRIVPVDLNALLYGMERGIAANCRLLRDAACAAAFDRAATARGTAIGRHLWSPAGYYADHDLDAKRTIARPTAAMAFPLFVGVAEPARARMTASALTGLMREGGVVTTPVDTGQQWDAPNGWAPLQWVAYTGLRRYGLVVPAERLRTAWMDGIAREYGASGRLLEKYDVVTRRAGGGGEYPTQDGFGWTNGVYAAMAAAAPARLPTRRQNSVTMSK